MVDIVGAVARIGCWDVLAWLMLICVVYVLFLKKRKRSEESGVRGSLCALPPMPKRDFRVHELLPFDGVHNPRILLALCGKVYDVTRGNMFYGPEGPYSKLAGHDATRALGTMDPNDVKDTPDDLSDLPESQMDTAKEWAQSFAYKYPVVGRLLAEGEEPTDYKGEMASL